MIEAGHFAELENILRLTLRESACVIYCCLMRFADLFYAGKIKSPQSSTTMENQSMWKKRTQKKESRRMTSRHSCSQQL